MNFDNFFKTTKYQKMLKKILAMFETRGYKILSHKKVSSEYSDIVVFNLNDGSKILWTHIKTSNTKVKESDIKTILHYALNNIIKHIIITGNKPFDSTIRKRKDLSCEHIKIELINKASFIHLYKKNLIYTLYDNLPKHHICEMSKDDKVSEYYDFKVGDIIKIVNTQTNTVTYRIIK